MKKQARTRLATLEGPTVLPEQDLARVTGGWIPPPGDTRRCMSDPDGPDDIRHYDDF